MGICWALSWLCFWGGCLLATIGEKLPVDWNFLWYPSYNNLMGWSCWLQGSMGKSGPWTAEQQQEDDEDDINT